ncbi:MAG: DUF4230 domain-containing protein [Roseburia sp.]|nr:DUF4230 domain-containing protein [Roseburia sp.]
MIFHNNKNDVKKTEKRSLWRVIPFTLFAVLLIFCILYIKNNFFQKGTVSLKDNIGQMITGEEGKLTTISKASLDKIFEISELSTADYVYNAVARAYGEDKTTVKYYVAYEGKVKAGIDFSKITFDIDEETKTIRIIIPAIEFQEQTVDPGTLKYIFKDKKSERENIHQEAFELCEKDLKERIGKEEDLAKLAEKNAVTVVKGLVEPWVAQIDNEYSIIVQ